MTFPFGEPVVVHRRTGSTRDQDNNLVPSFTDVPYSRASITSLESESETDSRDTTVYVLKIVLRPGIEVTSSDEVTARDRKSTRLNSSHVKISYAVFCL